MTDRRLWKPLDAGFKAAVRAYERASRGRLQAREAHDTLTAPLYHYTDARGLEGIIAAREIWFTHYRHLNDPSEMEFGMSVAKAALAEVGARFGAKVSIFCKMVDDLFSSDNLRDTLEFYIASFSRDRDNLPQWQAYAADGQGFALGLAPQLFAVEDKPDRKPHENVYVVPVCYGPDAGRVHHLAAVESAVCIVPETVERKAKAMRDINKGMPFFDEMAKNLLAAEMILNSLTTKHGGYEHEHEVRLFIPGQPAKLKPYVSKRTRGPEIVPFIKSDMPIQRPGSIVEIIVGPSAPPDAEDFACSLLSPFHSHPRSIIRRSIIPYRALNRHGTAQ